MRVSTFVWRTVLMVTLLSGWPGRVIATPVTPPAPAPAPAAPATQQAPESVEYRIEPGADGSVTLTAAAGDLVVRKAVRSDGTSVVTLERGTDAVRVETTPVSVTVRRGRQRLTVDVNASSESQTEKIQLLLAGSPALRALRAVVARLEEQNALEHQPLALRLTAALVDQLDGVPGAPERLARALDARFGTGIRRVRRQTDCMQAYAWAVTKASWDLQACYYEFSYWNPLRYSCTFYWTLQVESAWFQFLACSSFPIK